MSKATHFVDNEKFWQCLKDYKEARIRAEQENLPEPPIPEYAAECIMLIAQNLCKRPNFSGYTFVDEMVGDGIEEGIRKIKKFDPDISKQPFSYFTLTIWRKFVNRIKIEKTQTKTKKKLIENASIDLADFVEGDYDPNQLSDIQEEALGYFNE